MDEPIIWNILFPCTMIYTASKPPDIVCCNPIFTNWIRKFYRHISFNIKFSDRLIASHWLLTFIKYCSTKSREFRLNFISKHILCVLNKYYFFCWVARSTFNIRCASEKSIYVVCDCDAFNLFRHTNNYSSNENVLDQSRSNIEVATKSRCINVLISCSSFLQSHKLIRATVAHSPLEIGIENHTQKKCVGVQFYAVLSRSNTFEIPLAFHVSN